MTFTTGCYEHADVKKHVLREAELLKRGHDLNINV